ncbi:ribose-5-phosphate isomerase RpiA [Buchnera aphidicola (Ceratoglyphina bambusae)]|uniref:ribose-5-phosphate isomerase RpiA n=1 Tax=Buchnera aphidicola TaxID=9 RepID=UPI0031B8344D
MNINKLKKKSAIEAIKYVPKNAILGIGTGSTVLYFIKELSKISSFIKGVVSSSKISTLYLKKYNIKTFDVKYIDKIEIYVDGADEINDDMQMLKGGGGALTGEKILSEMANTFVCIADFTKKVNILGSKNPLPIEIISIAYSFIKSKIIELGGFPVLRKNFLTDYKNIILDVYDLVIDDPINIEKKINNIPGVVTVGLFSIRKADVAIIAYKDKIRVIKK